MIAAPGTDSTATSSAATSGAVAATSITALDDHLANDTDTATAVATVGLEDAMNDDLTPISAPVPPTAADAHLDTLVDRAAAALRADTPPDADVAAAGARAWARITAAAGDGLAGTGSTAAVAAVARVADDHDLARDYLAGRLSPAQALLVADRIREDTAFRMQVEAARRGTTPRVLAPVAAPALAAARRPRRLAWPLAAAAAIAMVVGSFLFARDTLQPNRVLAQVAAVDGGLIEIADTTGGRPLAVGDTVLPRQALRTSGGQGAVVTLNDGSTIEMGPRSELALASRWNGLAVELARGDVIVHAAPQGRGKLRVATSDVDVAVKGTIFAVRHGAKGSRVSVVEGEVEVDGARGRQTLQPGMQYTSRAALAAVPVADDIVWSRHGAEYRELLAALDRLGTSIDASVALPAPRAASALLDGVPADTAVYVALPNLGATVADAYTQFRAGVAADPALRDWWAGSIDDPAVEARLDAAIRALGELGASLGDEVVIAAGMGDGDADGAPLLLAEAADPAAVRAVFETRLAELAVELPGGGATDGSGDAPVRVLDDAAALGAAAEAEAGTASGEGDAPLYVWLGEGPMLVSPSAARIAAARTGPRGLPADFRAAIVAGYRGGVDALLAVDVGRVADGAEDIGAAEGDPLGLAGARYAVVTQARDGDRARIEADLTFGADRSGMAGWLASPGTMGALDYVSPDAYVAGAALIDAPERVLPDFIGLGRAVTADENAASGREAGGDLTGDDLPADIVADLARALGAEVAFAVDGPLLPEPAWKLIVEVEDPATLQAALGRAVAHVNARLAGEGRGVSLGLSSAERDGRTIWTLAVAGGDAAAARALDGGTGVDGVAGADRGRASAGDAAAAVDPRADMMAMGQIPAMHWLYTGGYLIAAADPSLLTTAIRTRESGVTLARSDAFTRALPAGAETDFSAVLWQDFGRLTRVLAGASGDGAGGQDMDAEDLMLGDLAAKVAPSLVYAWAEPRRLRFAGASESSPFGFAVLLRLLGGAVDDGGPGADAAAPGGLPWPASPVGDGLGASNT